MRTQTILAILLLAVVTALGIVTTCSTGHAASVTLGWDAYTEQADIDGFYIYMTPTSPVVGIPANRIATVAKTAVQQTITGISLGGHVFAMSAYKGTLESDLSNEATGNIKPKKPTGLIITITP